MTRVLRLHRSRVLLPCVLFVIGCIVYVVDHWYDACGGEAYTKALCEQYEAGRADGSLCGDLCRRKTLTLRSCIYNSNGYRLFHYGNYYLKVLESKFMKSPIWLTRTFVKPKTGVDFQEFHDMVKRLLDLKLGPGAHSELLEDILDAADANRDSSVSLAEAKTMWALLRHHEFFMLTMLRNVQHIPAIGGFCGDMYAVQAVNHTPLYVCPSNGWGVVTAIRQWGQLDWTKRGKIAVGLLEFVSEIYHHRSNGMVYVCDASENAFGYTDSYDLMVADVSLLRPRHELQLLVENQKCSVDSECRYLKDCVFRCDSDRNLCTADLVRPNLVRICHLLTRYLGPNIPRIIRADFSLLLEKCSNLNSTLPHSELDHSLISNDLRLLLWRYVSDFVS